MKISFGKRPHRGGLKESLKEAIKISQKEFEELLPKYEHYCYDKRVSQLLFIAKDIKREPYTWIYIQVNE